MRFYIETIPAKWARLRPWHRWFAWRPVHVGDGKWVWLETVWRSLRPDRDHYIRFQYLADDVAMVQWKMEHPNEG